MTSPLTTRPYLSLIQQAAMDEGITIEAIEPNHIYRLQTPRACWLMMGVDPGLNDSTAFQLAKSKSATYAVLSDAKVPAVPHHFLNHPDAPRGSSSVFGKAEKWHKYYDSPVVVKPDDGSQGRQVSLVENVNQLQQHLTELFIRSQHAALSPFMEGKYEYRIVVLDGESVFGFAKIQPDGEWRHNLVHGAKAEEIASAQLPELAALACAGANALGLRFCTVDILDTNAQGPMILEVNGTVYLSEYVKGSSHAREKVYNLYRKAFRLKMAQHL